MQKFDILTATAVPLLRPNIDTDTIIPSREMSAAARGALAIGLFAGWRYMTIGSRQPNPDFVLNQGRYRDARILIAGENFGCGSSREHAVWALQEYGIRVIVAPTFAPIFSNNCVRNGIVPAQVTLDAVQSLAAMVTDSTEELLLSVDLAKQIISIAGNTILHFRIDSEAKRTLLQGVDEIDLTLESQCQIEAFVASDRRKRPWIYDVGG